MRVHNFAQTSFNVDLLVEATKVRELNIARGGYIYLYIPMHVYYL